MKPLSLLPQHIPYPNPGKAILGKASQRPLPLSFTPLRIKNVEFKNRYAVSPMCMYSCLNGVMNQFHLIHYSQFALRGCGFIMFEATAVMKNGPISPDDSGIWNDEQKDALKQIVDSVHRFGSKAGIQLAHAGRKASTYSLLHKDVGRDVFCPLDKGGWNNIYAPSPIPYSSSTGKPMEMTLEQIDECVEAFASAAVRAKEAGFDVIEIHGAHGYLVHEFLSPVTNKRTDEYGGSFENRIRFLTRIVKRVRQVWPEENPLFVRLSCTDCLEHMPEIESWTLDQTIELCKILKTLDVDLIDCSSGGNDSRQKFSNLGPGYQVSYAVAIKEQVGIPVGAVGLLTDAAQIEEVLQNDVEMAFLAREFLRNPNFVLNAENELKRAEMKKGNGGDAKQIDEWFTVQWPYEYDRGKQHFQQ